MASDIIWIVRIGWAPLNVAQTMQATLIECVEQVAALSVRIDGHAASLLIPLVREEDLEEQRVLHKWLEQVVGMLLVCIKFADFICVMVEGVMVAAKFMEVALEAVVSFGDEGMDLLQLLKDHTMALALASLLLIHI